MRTLLALFFIVSLSAWAAPTLKFQGSTTVNPVVTEAAEVFRAKGWKVFVDTQGGSSGGITAVAEGQVDVGMISKPISESDKKKYPKVDFISHQIGADGVALVVSKKVYDGGVKALTREQIKNIYEGKIKKWSEVGGPNSPIVFFNKEPGRGTWEVFATYLYEKPEKAPSVVHPEVGSNEEGRTKVAGHSGGITQLSASWGEGEKIHTLAIKTEEGKEVTPTRENIFSGKYPLVRQLSLVTNGKPSAAAKEFIDYLKTDEGQKLMVKNGYLPLQVKP